MVVSYWKFTILKVVGNAKKYVFLFFIFLIKKTFPAKFTKIFLYFNQPIAEVGCCLFEYPILLTVNQTEKHD